MTAKVLCFAGSLRKDSFNKMLVRVAMEGARQAGAEVTYVDLADLPMPLYNGDLEVAEGLPANAKVFKQMLREHDGLLISSPEYNSSISAALKNAIDWASRAESGEPALVAFSGKVAGLLAASPGALGGLRGLVTVRSILGNIGVIVIPQQLAVPKCNEIFGPDGVLNDPRSAQSAMDIGARVAEVASKLKAPHSVAG